MPHLSMNHMYYNKEYYRPLLLRGHSLLEHLRFLHLLQGRCSKEVLKKTKFSFSYYSIKESTLLSRLFGIRQVQPLVEPSTKNNQLGDKK